jgi:hypothetical protein
MMRQKPDRQTAWVLEHALQAFGSFSVVAGF